MDQQLDILRSIDVTNMLLERREHLLGNLEAVLLDVQEPLETGLELVETLFLCLLVRDAHRHRHLIACNDALVERVLGLRLDHLGLQLLVLALGHARGQSL